MRFKRFTAGIVAAVMAVTAVATPLGDNLPAVRESTSLTASAAEISTDGYYTLKNLYAGKMLNVRGSYSTSNTNVTVYETDGTTGQQFRFIKSGSNYVLEPKCAPSCALNVYGTSASNGSNVNIWTKSGNSTQAWVMEYNSSSAAYVIRCAANTNLVLTATGTSNSSNVALANYSSGNKSQLWSAAKVGGSTPSPSGAITTQSIQAVLDKYNYKTGKYWTPINAGDSRTSGYMGSDRPSSTSYYYDKGSQCWGFANFVLHEVTGTASNPNNGNNSNWEKLSPSQVSSLKVGDHVRIKYWSTKNNAWSWHSGVVLTANGDNYTFAECWGGVNNKIVIGGKLNASYGTMSSIKSVLEFVYRYKGSHTHSYGSWYTKTSPTCTSGGTEERKCSCGATESRSTSALGHSYGSWYTSVNPGCTTAGTEKRVCSRCNSAETRSTSATGHSYGYWETDREATCTEEGTEVRICSKCNDAEYRTVSALGHNYSSQWTIDKPATCSAEGSKSRHCTRCDAKTEVTAIAKIAHTYTSKVVKPTLTEQGYTLYTCSVCGYSYKDNYTAVRENPSKVTGLAFGARSADYVSLKWNKDANADGYIVEYLSGNKFVKLTDKTSELAVSYKVTGLEAGTLYKFRVRSYVNENGKRVYGEYSDVLNVRTLPKAMSNLKLGARTDNSISLKWDKNETANGAVVEMYKNGQWVVIATKTSNTAVSHKITGLDASTAYKFRVRAYINDEGGRIYSVYNTTLNEATAPAAVKNFRRTISAKTAIRFNWDKNTTADGYSFEMIKNSKWTTVATIEDGTATNYSQLKLNPGTAYRFRIRAYKVVNGKKIFSGYSYVNASTAK